MGFLEEKLKNFKGDEHPVRTVLYYIDKYTAEMHEQIVKGWKQLGTNDKGQPLTLIDSQADQTKKIEAIIEASPSLRPFKNQLLLDITTEGLRIQIVDEQNRPMFDSGGAELKPYTRDILRQIGKALNDVKNRISLAGHTDAAGFVGGSQGFTNWELSSNRANASRRELVAGGMDDSKVLRVVGLASTVLFDKNDPLGSVNRRISIVVLNQKTEDAILQEEGPASDEADEESLPDGLKLPGVGKGTAG